MNTTMTHNGHTITVSPMQCMDIHLNPKNGFSALIVRDEKQVKRLWATTAKEVEVKAKEYIDTTPTVHFLGKPNSPGENNSRCYSYRINAPELETEELCGAETTF